MWTCCACVRVRPLAPGGVRKDIVAQTRHSCRQYTQARQEKCVRCAIVRITILHIHHWKRVTEPYPNGKRRSPRFGGTRPTNKSRQIVARTSRVKLCKKECAERHGATTHRQLCPDQTQSPRCVTAPNTYQGGKAQWQGPVEACGWGPRGQWQCGWGSPQATGRGWQGLNPLTSKTAHRLQHTRIEGAGVESQTACGLRRVMRTNPQGTLAG